MNERENFLRSLEFRNPHWIPFSVGFAWPVWHKYREDLEELVLRYPGEGVVGNASHAKVFGHYKKGSVSFDADPGPCHRQGEYFRDNWGCLWYNMHQGIEGQVVESPLADWKALDTYRPPDLLKYTERGQRDWDRIKKEMEERKKRGLLTWGDGERLFDRLYFLRGFENLMVDIATDDPHLPQLMNMLTEYEMRLVNKWLSIGVDVISFHTDIGIQDRLMISPVKFRQYIKPMFKRIFMTCRNAGVHVLLSSDGRLLEIVDDLIECGVSRHDPQIRANTGEGVVGNASHAGEGIEKFYKGKICINLDLDRQMFPFCSPSDIKEQVKEAVERLSLPEGGLMIFADVRDSNIPLENI